MIDQKTYVTDPAPSHSTGAARCEFKLYPNADEVIFCDNTATWAVIAPCCRYASKICSACLEKFPKSGWWQCHHCGKRTNAPASFGLRRLA